MSLLDRPSSEPSAARRLHWGHYHPRYVAGLLLLFAGGLALAGSNTYVLSFLLLGTISHVGGWVILPGPGVRRTWVAAPSLVAVWLLLTGPQSVPVLVIPFVAWLFVRQRPALSYLAALPVLAITLIIANLYSEHTAMPLALAVSAIALIGSAWLARFIARLGRTPSVFAASSK